MLIRIDRSVVDTETNPHSWSHDTITALENLALARREGKHSIIAERETLKKIGQCEDLSKNTIRIYNKILNNFSKYQKYLSIVTQYVEINNSCIEPSLKKINDKLIIQVPPKFFQDSEQIQKTILLCENAMDADFYQILAKVSLTWKKANPPLSFEPRGGGGTTIKTEYENILKEQKRFCLCLVDCDRISPNDSLGETAKQTQEKNRTLDPYSIKTQVFILDVREIENLIPIPILAKVSLDSYRQKALKLLEEIHNCSANEIEDFLDIKEGIKLEKIIAKQSELIQKFWKPKTLDLLKICEIDPLCLDLWKCNNTENCHCHIALGFGKNILENSVESMKKESNFAIGKVIKEPLRSHWEKIGQAIVNWCLADSRTIS